MRTAMRWSVLFVALGALVVAGCKGGGSPKEAFGTWMKAIEKCDSGAIKAGLTKDSVTQIETAMKQIAAFMPPEQAKDFDFFKEICKGFKTGQVEVKDEQVTGDTAMLTVKTGDKEDKVPLKKEDGAWKIDFAGVMKDVMKAPGGGGEAAPPTPPATPPSP